MTISNGNPSDSGGTPLAGEGLLAEHRFYAAARRCTCGWEGDNAVAHVIDVIGGLPLAERMALMGMVAVGPAYVMEVHRG